MGFISAVLIEMLSSARLPMYNAQIQLQVAIDRWMDIMDIMDIAFKARDTIAKN